MSRHFGDRVIETCRRKRSNLILGCDPQLRYLPQGTVKAAFNEYGPGIRATMAAFRTHFMNAIDIADPYIAGIKPQSAFYEKYGHYGAELMEDLFAAGHERELIVVDDAKREDGDDTAKAYAAAYLGEIDIIGEGGEIQYMPSPMQVDALTVTPWIAKPCYEQFRDTAMKHGNGFFVVVRTSFNPTSPYQDGEYADGDTGWIKVAKSLQEMCEDMCGESGYSSMGVVIGATRAEDAPLMRKILPRSIGLVPGYGGQGADADFAVANCDNNGLGVVVNNSRQLGFAHIDKYRPANLSADTPWQDCIRERAMIGQTELNDAIERRIERSPW